ncbi:hypothetical protein OO014_11615 [Intrasporangium calvum]|uniref:Uncharacterized protein n=1 Tax=Intrasporangium calvum TaxID=53358 RepID=A0ABT5GI59_9MICO|nr:hypothetical protein [Intrasporangium calvum]MDC5697909.1 hypothetical protein [Intrasporangium calvum]
MRRRLITKVGLYPLVAAGTFLAFGAVAESAVASPQTVSVAGPQCDCGKDDEDHDHAAHADEAGHTGDHADDHADAHGDEHGDEHGAEAASDDALQVSDDEMDHSQMGDGEMDHSQMSDGEMDHSQMSDEEMDHSQMDGEDHGGHGSVSAGPDDASRNLVLGGFAGVNAAVLGAAGVLRRRTAERRDRQTAARAAARPARRIVSGDER